jgi:hypothetical protein
MLTRHHVGMPCLRSPIAMVSVLATSRGLCGHCSWRWDIASPHFSSLHQGCFTGTHTFGACVWSSTRGLQSIIFTASAKWSRLPHRGRSLREAWDRLPEKLWCFYNMKWRNKWRIHSTTTSWAMPKKEMKPWWCLQEIVTTLGALPTKWNWFMLWSEILMRPSRRSSC